MTNEKIILKVQEIQAHIEMLSRKIEEQQPQEVAKVTVDVDAIVEQSVAQCKKLIAPLKAQNTKLKNDNAIVIEDLKSEIELLTKENKEIKKSVEGLRLNIEKEILKVTKNINAVNSTFNDCTDVLSENLKRNIKSNAKSQSAKLEDLQLLIESNNKHLDKKISMVSDEAAKQVIENIAHAIDEKVNINFVNNLYRNK